MSIITKSKTPVVDTSHQEIYDFMREVIKIKKLDQGYSIALIPQNELGSGKTDKEYLKSLVISPEDTLKKSTDKFEDIFLTLPTAPKTLTPEDMDYMLKTKKRLNSFKWNNSRLGFYQPNAKNWYRFSVPMFSRDKQTVIMTIKDLCPGLCGKGEVVVFNKQTSGWVAHSIDIWRH